MVRRSLPLVLVLAVAGAPVALEFCQLTCAWAKRQAPPSDAARDHSCHHQEVPSGIAISAVPHACAHVNELAAAPGAATPRASTSTRPAAPTAVHTAITIPPQTAGDRVQRAAGFLYRGDFRPAIPLRI
jgi:hypothetical protein